MDKVLTLVQSNPTTVAAIGLAIAGLYFVAKKAAPKDFNKFEKDVVYLFTFGPADVKVPHASPFVLKVALFLKYANIPHKVIYTSNRNSRNKLPYVHYNGETINDSHFIIKKLSEKFNVVDIYNVKDEERANEIIIRRFIEDAFYWTLVYYRWVDEKHNEIDRMLAAAPKILLAILKYQIPKVIKSQVYQTGYGRYEEEERISMIKDDIFALSTILSNKQYLFGDRLSYADFCMFSMLAEMYYTDRQTPARMEILSHPNLVDYLERIKNKYFKDDWDQSLTAKRNQKKSKQN